MPQETKQQAPKFSVAIREEKIQQLINNTLGDPVTAKKFVAEVSSLVGNDYNLSKCTTNSIITSALLAQSLNLPLAKALGLCYLIPRKDKNGYLQAQFQVGWKGFVQLAVRTNQYENIGVRPVHKGEWVGQDEFGEDLFKFDHKFDNEPVIGYFAYLKLLSGFKKTFYWTVAQCEKHGSTYSDSHKGKNKGSEYDRWATDFDAMSMKTVLKQLITKYGVMTTELQTAIEADQAVINENGKYDYVDNVDEEDELNETVVVQNDRVEPNFDEPEENPFEEIAKM